MSEEDFLTTNITEEVINTTLPTKSTPYIPPRIDDHLYQTAIPDLQPRPKRGNSFNTYSPLKF